MNIVGRRRFASWFRFARCQKGLTVAALSACTDIPSLTLLAVEEGRRRQLSMTACEALAHVLGVRLAELFSFAQVGPEIFTRDHPRWPEFITWLSCSTFCDVRNHPEGASFRCGAPGDEVDGGERHSADFRKATAVLRLMTDRRSPYGFDLERARQYFRAEGAKCDCAILTKLVPECWTTVQPADCQPWLGK